MAGISHKDLKNIKNVEINETDSDHPLEQLFDIEENSTITDVIQYTSSPLVEHEHYDNKDKEIEQDIQRIYDLAIEGYLNQLEDIADIEPKYKARSNEVAIQYLQSALNAAKEKASLKVAKEKIKKSSPGTVNNNLILDRNELLKMLQQPRSEEKQIYDVDTEDNED